MADGQFLGDISKDPRWPELPGTVVSLVLLVVLKLPPQLSSL